MTGALNGAPTGRLRAIVVIASNSSKNAPERTK